MTSRVSTPDPSQDREGPSYSPITPPQQQTGSNPVDRQRSHIPNNSNSTTQTFRGGARNQDLNTTSDIKRRPRRKAIAKKTGRGRPPSKPATGTRRTVSSKIPRQFKVGKTASRPRRKKSKTNVVLTVT